MAYFGMCALSECNFTALSSRTWLHKPQNHRYQCQCVAHHEHCSSKCYYVVVWIFSKQAVLLSAFTGKQHCVWRTREIAGDKCYPAESQRSTWKWEPGTAPGSGEIPSWHTTPQGASSALRKVSIILGSHVQLSFWKLYICLSCS